MAEVEHMNLTFAEQCIGENISSLSPLGSQDHPDKVIEPKQCEVPEKNAVEVDSIKEHAVNCQVTAEKPPEDDAKGLLVNVRNLEAEIGNQCWMEDALLDGTQTDECVPTKKLEAKEPHEEFLAGDMEKGRQYLTDVLEPTKTVLHEKQQFVRAGEERNNYNLAKEVEKLPEDKEHRRCHTEGCMSLLCAHAEGHEGNKSKLPDSIDENTPVQSPIFIGSNGPPDANVNVTVGSLESPIFSSFGTPSNIMNSEGLVIPGDADNQRHENQDTAEATNVKNLCAEIPAPCSTPNGSAYVLDQSTGAGYFSSTGVESTITDVEQKMDVEGDDQRDSKRVRLTGDQGTNGNLSLKQEHNPNISNILKRNSVGMAISPQEVKEPAHTAQPRFVAMDRVVKRRDRIFAADAVVNVMATETALNRHTQMQNQVISKNYFMWSLESLPPDSPFRGKHLHDIEDLADVNMLLELWLLGTRKLNGKEYKGKTLYTAVAALNRVYQDAENARANSRNCSPRPTSFFKEGVFAGARRVLDARMSDASSKGLVSAPIGGNTPDDIVRKILNSGVLFQDNAQSAQWRLFFSYGIRLTLRGRQGYNIKFSQLALVDDGKPFVNEKEVGARVIYTPRPTEKLSLIDRKRDPLRRRIMQCSCYVDVRLCPVEVYKDIKRRRPNSCSDQLYLQPLYVGSNRKGAKKQPGPIFSRQGMGSNKIGDMLKDICAAAGIPGADNWTNHMLRMNGVWGMVAAGYSDVDATNDVAHNSDARANHREPPILPIDRQHPIVVNSTVGTLKMNKLQATLKRSRSDGSQPAIQPQVVLSFGSESTAEVNVPRIHAQLFDHMDTTATNTGSPPKKPRGTESTGGTYVVSMPAVTSSSISPIPTSTVVHSPNAHHQQQGWQGALQPPHSYVHGLQATTCDQSLNNWGNLVKQSKNTDGLVATVVSSGPLVLSSAGPPPSTIPDMSSPHDKRLPQGWQGVLQPVLPFLQGLQPALQTYPHSTPVQYIVGPINIYLAPPPSSAPSAASALLAPSTPTTPSAPSIPLGPSAPSPPFSPSVPFIPSAPSGPSIPSPPYASSVPSAPFVSLAPVAPPNTSIPVTQFALSTPLSPFSLSGTSIPSGSSAPSAPSSLSASCIPPVLSSPSAPSVLPSSPSSSVLPSSFTSTDPPPTFG